MSSGHSDEMEAAAQRAQDRRSTRCQYGPMPGTCPGPAYCPMSDFVNEMDAEIEDWDAPS